MSENGAIWRGEPTFARILFCNGMAFLRRLLELLLKRGELVFQIRKVVAEQGDFLFETSDAVEVGGTGGDFGDTGMGRGLDGGRLRCGFADVAGEKMSVAGFFRAGLAGEDGDERRLAFAQQIEGGVDGPEIVKLVEALAAGAELTGSLRTA